MNRFRFRAPSLGALARLAETLATVDTAAPRAILAAMKARETEIDRVEHELAALDQAVAGGHAGPSPDAIAQRLKAALQDWRGMLRRHPTLARQLLRKIIQGPMVVVPERREEQPGYRVRGQASVEPLLTIELQRLGATPALFQNRESAAQGVASPTGFDTSCMDFWRRFRAA